MENDCKGLAKDKCLPPKCTYAEGKVRQYCKKNTRNKLTSPAQKKSSPIQRKKSSPIQRKSPVTTNQGCKGVAKDKCLPPKCTYVNGKLRQYCKTNTRKKSSPIQRKKSSPIQRKKSSPIQRKSPVTTNQDCKGVSKDKCLPPKCTYVNGKVRQYCKKNTKKIKQATPKQRLSPPANRIPMSFSPEGFEETKYNSQHISSKERELTPLQSLSPSPPKRIPISFSPQGFEETKEHSPRHISSKEREEREERQLTPISKSKSKSLSPKPRKSTSSNEKRNKTKKGNLIKKFIVKNKSKLTALFLNAICQDSGVCMAFGKETDKIKSFFNNYENFNYAINQHIIASGNNGIVIEIEYERLKYKSFAILKKAKLDTSDNLFYEYVVGQFINTHYKKLPCLLQTYGLFFSQSGHWNDLNALQHMDTKTNVKLLLALKQSCLTPINMLLLTEHIKESQTVQAAMLNDEFVYCDLIHTLFQVYFTLNALKDVFTHYDLHNDNILTYIPVKNSYIQYHFHFANETISFKSPYLIKIIDYGRCYFDNTNGINSEYIYKAITNINCGIFGSQGFTWFEKSKKLTKNYYYINSLIPNRSHDLRLVNEIKQKLNLAIIVNNLTLDNVLLKDITTIFTKVLYSDIYGTNQKLSSGLPNKVHNVMDAFNLLKKICMHPMFQQDNDKFYLDPTERRYGFTKLGDLHIYSDGSNKDMVFTPI